MIKITRRLFSGSKFPYPKDVWTPTGGWWPNPKHWKRSTVFAFIAMFALAVPVFEVSRRLERRPLSPIKPIPSQRWCTHTLDDDPDYPERLKLWREKRELLPGDRSKAKR